MPPTAPATALGTMDTPYCMPTTCWTAQCSRMGQTRILRHPAGASYTRLATHGNEGCVPSQLPMQPNLGCTPAAQPPQSLLTPPCGESPVPMPLAKLVTATEPLPGYTHGCLATAEPGCAIFSGAHLEKHPCGAQPQQWRHTTWPHSLHGDNSPRGGEGYESQEQSLLFLWHCCHHEGPSTRPVLHR